MCCSPGRYYFIFYIILLFVFVKVIQIYILLRYFLLGKCIDKYHRIFKPIYSCWKRTVHFLFLHSKNILIPTSKNIFIMHKTYKNNNCVCQWLYVCLLHELLKIYRVGNFRQLVQSSLPCRHNKILKQGNGYN